MDSEIRTEWDLSLLYEDHKDPKINKDVSAFITSIENFSKKYSKTNFTSNSKSLKKALIDYEILLDHLNDGKPLVYFHYLTELNSKDEYAQAQIAKLSHTLSTAENLLIFFELEIGKINSAKQKQYLEDKDLENYHYYLKRRFLESKYDLSEPEEKIMNLLNLPGFRLWVNGVEKSLNQKTIVLNGKTKPITEVLSLLADLKTPERRSVHKKIIAEYKNLSDFSESEINSVITYKKITDEIRKVPKPYTIRILSNENQEKTVLSLVNSVTNDFKNSERFYNIKKKLLKLDHLEYVDRFAKVGEIKKEYEFPKAIDLIGSRLGTLDPVYKKILKNMVQKGQIDVYPKKGKSGGAFCSSSHKSPTYILLNYKDNIDSVLTLSHELGHAIHAEFSKSQPILYEGHSLSTAETASTFFETIIFNEIAKSMSEKEKVIMLHNKIQESIQTIHRQIAFFNYELDLHNQIREKGALSNKELTALLMKHMKAYLGRSFKISNDDGYEYIHVSHFRRFFYVYTYAFGQLISMFLVDMVEKDPKNIIKVNKFLSAGRSDTPENIFKEIGIDITKPEFFNTGLKQLEKDINQLDTLVKAL